MTVVFRTATSDDIEAIVRVVNAAYVVEKEFKLDGVRTSPDDVAAHLESGTFLIAEEDGAMAGCVYVTAREGQGYFGMLSVAPDRQYGGLGKQLVAAAEEHCLAAGCSELSIYVVSARTVLFPWYEKQGYHETGREPFPQPERMTIPVEVVVMKKILSPVAAP